MDSMNQEELNREDYSRRQVLWTRLCVVLSHHNKVTIELPHPNTGLLKGGKRREIPEAT
jgi:hypothetical protein